MRHKLLNTRSLVLMAMLSAIAILLMLLRFPIVFIAPSFYKLDFSDLPALIGAFALGPMAGGVIEFIKIVLNLAINGTDSAFIGEISNFIMGLAYVLPAGLIYKYNHTRKGAYLGIASGVVSLTIAGTLLNVWLLLPWYANNFFASAGGMDTLLQMGAEIHPVIGSVWGFGLLCVAPFNLIKGLLCGIIAAIIYKPLSGLIHNFRDGR